MLFTHEPIGVVGAVVPWNYALLMPVWKLAPRALGRQAMIEIGAEHALVDATMGYLRRAEVAGHGAREFAVLFELLRHAPQFDSAAQGG